MAMTRFVHMRGLWPVLVVALLACSTTPDDSSADNTLKAECKDLEEKFGLQRKAELQVSRDNQPVDDGATVTAAASSLSPGQTVDTVFVFRNVAESQSARPLVIKAISTSYSPPGGKENEDPAFVCIVKAGDVEFPCSDTDKLGSLIPSGMDTKCLLDSVKASARTQIELIARYTRPDDNFARSLVMAVLTEGDENWKSKPYRLTVTTKVGVAKIKVSPEVVEFDTVPYGESDTQAFKITNIGEAPLKVSALVVAPKDGKSFSANLLDKDYKGGLGEHVIDPPVEVKPQQSETVKVTFTALDQNSHASQIDVKSNDPETTYSKVLLRANQKVPCISYIPAALMNFGFVFLGTAAEKMLGIRNCGSETAEVSNLELIDNPDSIFSLDTTNTKGLAGEMPSADKPLSLIVNDEIGLKKNDGVVIKCSPESAKTYKAKLKYTDNTLLPPAKKVIELLCNGTNQACPTPVIHGDEEIIPQMKLCLTGDKSFALPGKKVAKWEWKVVEKPKGAESHTFYPSNKTPNVCFGVKGDSGDVTVNVAGKYVFELRVWDGEGNESCAPAIHPVAVIPDEAIHVELLWDTPGDTDKVCEGGDNSGKKCSAHDQCPDGSCEHDKGLGAGTDMDLHFAHQLAMLTNTCTEPPKICKDSKGNSKPCYCLPDQDGDGKTDPWFHKDYDCYWLNPNPNWGSADGTVDDNPGLDLDDTDGWGPENLNLKEAENGIEYWVGVHYWKDNGFGPSKATVRFYIWGNLELELTSESMKQCDMWWVKRISWPSGKLVNIGGAGGKYTPKYWSKVAAGLGAKCVKK